MGRKEGFKFKPAGTEDLFDFGPTIECRCKKGDSCSTNRIRGKCSADPDYNPVDPTAPPTQCKRVSHPGMPDRFEFRGPCLFPLTHAQTCLVNCDKYNSNTPKYGFARCQCKSALMKQVEKFSITVIGGS